MCMRPPNVRAIRQTFVAPVCPSFASVCPSPAPVRPGLPRFASVQWDDSAGGASVRNEYGWLPGHPDHCAGPADSPSGTRPSPPQFAPVCPGLPQFAPVDRGKLGRTGAIPAGNCATGGSGVRGFDTHHNLFLNAYKPTRTNEVCAQSPALHYRGKLGRTGARPGQTGATIV